MSDTSISKRRQPKQARSQQRVEHILATASALFAEQGYEAVSTNHIAKAAEVSIGSLYQFFPNKEAILDALVDKYLDDMQEALIGRIEDAASLEDAIQRMVQGMQRFGTSHKAFKHVFAEVQLIAVTNRIHDTIVGWVHDMIGNHYPQLAKKQCHIGAEVSLCIVKGVMQIYDRPNGMPPEQLSTEMQSALLAYIHDLVRRNGITPGA